MMSMLRCSSSSSRCLLKIIARVNTTQFTSKRPLLKHQVRKCNKRSIDRALLLKLTLLEISPTRSIFSRKREENLKKIKTTKLHKIHQTFNKLYHKKVKRVATMMLMMMMMTKNLTIKMNKTHRNMSRSILQTKFIIITRNFARIRMQIQSKLRIWLRMDISFVSFFDNYFAMS